MPNMETIQILNGDSLEVLKQFPDNHFDSVVTDPPYGLGKEPNAEEMLQAWITDGYLKVIGGGFMGKEWDAFVPQPIFWKEVFRVLKPGGHILAFYGTRTYDWGVMAMRLAGFEVRDCIQWIYGSGFPKSHNISKAIDKMPKANERLFDFAELLKKTRTELGLSLSEADKLICNGSTMYSFIEGRKVDGVLKIYPPNKEFYAKIQTHFKINGWDDIVENNLESIGIEIGSYGFQANNERWCKEKNITQITTDQAKQWEGWGSALKPANEPIVLARKPLEKGFSIAENVLKNGTGGINIDATRVGNIGATQRSHQSEYPKKEDGKEDRSGHWARVGHNIEELNKGRFPANLILTHHLECECIGTKKVKSDAHHTHKYNGKKTLYEGSWKDGEDMGNKFADENGEETIESWNCHEDCPIKIMDEQSGVSLSSGGKGNKSMGAMGKNGIYGNYSLDKLASNAGGFGDKGGASRFFYVAKASKKERNKGLEEFEEKVIEGRDEGQDERSVAYKPRPKPMANIHPTVKPVELMRYLIRMITPPNGIVLDPFNGSGTTGVACKVEGFNYVGIELDEEYCKISEGRIKNWQDEIEMPEVIQKNEQSEEKSTKNQFELDLF